MVYPKDEIVTLLDSDLDHTALTKDDAAAHAKFDVFVGNPPHLQVKDWLLSRGQDVLFTVSDLRAENKRIIGTVPLVEDGRYLVKTWTIRKTVDDTVVVDGVKLKQKADGEIKRVFRESSTDRYVVSWENNNRLINGIWIYCTIFTIAYMIQIIV